LFLSSSSLSEHRIAHPHGHDRPGDAIRDEFDADQYVNHSMPRPGQLPPDREAHKHRDDAIEEYSTPERE
jgi:hypothetical protein